VDGYRISGPAERIGGTAESDEYVPTIQAAVFDWVNAIRHERMPRVTGAIGRRSVALIETMYDCRQPLTYPWDACAEVEVSA
jgi:hypothetical protein